VSHLIRPMAVEDWAQVAEIYAQGIASGNATFETQAPEWDAWHAGHLNFARLVCADGDVVQGWAALSPVSRRQVYRGVAEVSVYVGQLHQGHGVGKTLLKALIEASEANSIWTLQAGIFPENEASMALHLRHGFREVGRRERIGQMNGVWRDTVLLERRSPIVGADVIT
jgi:L-amino acid N-acyltransferase YncA